MHFSLFINMIFIRYCLSKIFEHRHLYEILLSHIIFIILSCILTKRYYTLRFLYVHFRTKVLASVLEFLLNS